MNRSGKPTSRRREVLTASAEACESSSMEPADAWPRSRLLAVLVADVECFCGHMEIDERSTLAALDVGRQVFAEIASHHAGRIVDIAGDSVLAVFETMFGALTAAIEIQQRIDLPIVDRAGSRRMLFRIGIHLGDVLEQSNGSVYGWSVNLAARVQTLAEPGGIAVTDAVQCCARSRSTFSFSDHGMHQLKNIAQPIRIYRLSGGQNGASAHSAEDSSRFGK